MGGLKTTALAAAVLLATGTMAHAQESAAADPTAPAVDQPWAFHWQGTFTEQAHPGFRSPYRGPHSLDPSSRGDETSDLTLYAGVRPWKGGEIWIDPEIDQGFGLSNTLGLAAFPSGEAYKVGKSSPYLRMQRLFLRQTLDLGGDRSKVDPDLNVLGGSQGANRMVFTVGKFSVVDVFDNNSYAHDPRNDFMNWAIIDTATFDYAADAWGYSAGGSAELYEGNWAFRLGVFDLSDVPNSTRLESGFQEFQGLGEIERDYKLGDHAGKVRVNGFLSRGRMGTYADALALALATHTTPDTALVRQYRSRSGVAIDWEQEVAKDVGVFARAGWDQGDVEPYEFEDMDTTYAAGLSMKGSRWGRADDVWGLAGEIGSISKAHEAYLAAGGLGILVGDGRLPHEGDERVLETFYALPIVKNARASFDYQLFENPAFSRDRGPVSVFGLRLHVQR
ncbi:MAG TPA: carbohydrate porin [Caulobacteraceae bacterium]|jgi:high affinity Mn2+ porin|nr:carbohydrate porin [Caulobacteraceae bacterium]